MEKKSYLIPELEVINVDPMEPMMINPSQKGAPGQAGAAFGFGYGDDYDL